MDEVCSAAVRETFYRLFSDRLIYRGDRLVNWDCHLQTAVSDYEVYHETVADHFWHLRYPIIDPKAAEPTHIVVATTRPESMLGDTAVACHPNPKDALLQCIAEQKERRMLVMGLYYHGQVPFADCFVHAKILDGKGVTMSKSKGNGIDPVDIIERYGVDAMRYLICDMETGMQDVRLPVQASCPNCDKLVELTDAQHGRTIFSYLCTHCKTEFDVLGTIADLPSATVLSDRFEAGKNFCNKLWNAARFALMNLGEIEFNPLTAQQLADEDRWILSRLTRAVSEVSKQLSGYSPSAALNSARNFFWNELCDWYLEFIKPNGNGWSKGVAAIELDRPHGLESFYGQCYILVCGTCFASRTGCSKQPSRQ